MCTERKMMEVVESMASSGLGEELECSVCLSLYTDPVTLRCGHNFCRVCIDQVLNTQDESGVYSCPECREQFQERPALKRNITLCKVMENFLSTQPHQEEITGIRCTYCIHSPVPAVKSCLLCEASLCDNHLGVHSKSAEHVLTDSSTSLENKKCPVHKKVLEYYCTEDVGATCLYCNVVGEHQGHQVVELDETSEKKKEKLQKLTMKRQKVEKKVQSLEQRKRKAQEKAATEAERVTDLFADTRRQLNDLEKRVRSEVSRQEEQVSLSVSGLIQKLTIKKAELSKKIRHIKELFHMTDPLTVLQEPDTGDLCDLEEGGDKDTGDLCDAEEDRGEVDMVSHRSDQGAELISHTLHTVSEILRDVNVTFYGQGPADILLDVNTAGDYVLISGDLKTATRTEKNQNRPQTAKRFQYYQVMSSNRFSSGRHYWDVEISESGICWMGICYPSVDRSGEQSYIGHNKKSWCLFRGLGYSNRSSAAHDSREILLPHQISGNRVRIHVDYEAGQMSFYELCHPIKHLHTFTTTFTEPLHAALCVWKGCIKFSDH